MKNLPGYLLIFLFGIGASTFLVAAPKKEARVTQVIKDVRLLGGNGAPRPASVNDTVAEGNAVRTGGDSRAELTFTDQTLTRIGANTVFSFAQGAKEFDLATGAMLLAVPESAGKVRVNTAAATAAVTGFIALFESHKNSWNKVLVVEGEACVSDRKRASADLKLPPNPCITLHAGEMLLIRPNGTFTDKKTFNIRKVLNSALLITELGKLPKWVLDASNAEADKQEESGGPPGGYSDPTNPDATDQKNIGQPFPTQIPRPRGSPPSGSF